MRIFIEAAKNFTEEIKYVFCQLATDRNLNLSFTAQESQADITVGSKSTYDYLVATSFYDQLKNQRFKHSEVLKKNCLIYNEASQPDYLSTIFYMINSLQEYNDQDLDEIGRFKFANSYQQSFKNIENNLVSQYFSKICSHRKIQPMVRPENKSKFFLSHDIDSINGAWLQDSLYLLKNGNPFPIIQIIINALLQRPDWLNMEQIMKIEDEFSLKSTFFWLVNKGRLNMREVNGDYSIKSNTIQKTIRSIKDKGWENGLHKSISPNSFSTEISKSNFNPIANRNHYLKFVLPQLYEQIDESGLQLDASLGFAEAYGFRNSYGLPFHPFNFKTRKPYSFLEVPLTIMDGTLHRYMGIPVGDTASSIINFLEKNKHGCLHSILWHNTYFTKYKFKGYLQEYRKILQYLKESNFESINATGIIKEYGRNSH